MSESATRTSPWTATAGTGIGARLRGRLGRDAADIPEDELLDRARHRDDSDAFAELVRRHQGKVRGLLLRLTANRTLADDLGQEVFLRAYRGLVGFEGRARFSTWLYRIAYNVYLNHRTRTRELAPLPEAFELRTAAPEGRMSAAGHDLRRDLDAAIATLPDRYKSVITLYYLEDVSYPEIADVLDIPLGTVKTHLHRAKRMLRERLREWEDAR